MVNWSWFISWGWFVCWGFGGAWGSFVCYFDNVARIPISSVVLDNLGTAIGECNSVFSNGGISVTSFVCSKVYSGIFISDSVFVSIFSWDIVSWFFVGSWLVSRGWLVYWSGLVDWGWGSMVNWGRFVDRGSVVNWSGGGMVDWSGVDDLVSWSMGNSVAVAVGVTMFHRGMACNISIDSSQEGNNSDEGLEET